MVPLSCFRWISQLFQFEEIPIHYQSKNQTKGAWWMGKYDINGMCCFLIPWDGGICDGGNSCLSGGKIVKSCKHSAAVQTTENPPWTVCCTRNSPCHCQSGVAGTEAAKQPNERKKEKWTGRLTNVSTWRAEKQRAGRLSEWEILSDLPVAHRGAGALVLGVLSWRVTGTTQLLEDNLSPLILSPMWWHSLTSTICWNTSRSSRRCCCVKNPAPLPNHRSAAGWLLAARRQGQGHGSALRGDTQAGTRSHANTHARARACMRNRTQTCGETPRDGSKKTPSHRNLRGRVGGRDGESERCGKRRNGRGERVSGKREREREGERNSGSEGRTAWLTDSEVSP